ncbi:riboflavin synthase [Pedomonas mirosovicensis]|uniref:riboflavin synthase n=1 Tax=Pedomonas mirosovicensis TaxID=2908641 RepID=UPI0021670C84|nr:riboflavin synthase [Pedomonas mirosovicensis]MCH8685459.1 riboflavin synthase [Pedomonas mirosovicensis]
MFTGIITDIGTVRSIEQRGDTRIVLGTAFDLSTVEIGASIACSGVCLTVVDKGEDWFAVDVSGETLARSALASWQAGTPVNLERALKVGDELGGHIVTGHVDAVGRITSIVPDGASRRIQFQIPKALAPYVAQKGSVTVDGISLTVNAVEDSAEGALFEVNIIPHTQACTTLGQAKVGDAVNIEIDVLARYVARLKEVASC